MVKKLLLMLSVLCAPFTSFGAGNVEIRPELTSVKYIQTAKGVGLGLLSVCLWTGFLASLVSGCKEISTKDILRRFSHLTASACLLVPAYKSGTKSLEYLRTVWSVPHE